MIRFSHLVGFLCLIIALIILWQFRQILLLVYTSVILAIALNVLVKRLNETLNISRNKAMIIILILGLIIIIGFLLLFFPLITRQSQQVIELMPVGLANLSRWLNNLKNNPPYFIPESVLERITLPNFSDLQRQISSLLLNIFGSFYSLFSSSLTILLQLLLVIVLTLMLVAEPQSYRSFVLRLFPTSYRRRAEEIFSLCEIALVQVLGAILLKSLFVALLSFFGLLLLRVDYAFTHAVMAGLFNFIPNIGPLLSTVFPLSVALLNSGSQSIAVIVLYVIIQNIETYWFGPIILKKQVSLLPAATLIAQIFFATFFGPLGLLLAIPLAVIAQTWIKEAWLKDIIDKT